MQLYKAQTNFFDGREYEWKGITSKWINSSVVSTKNFIEFVTSPNNPDGLLHKSVMGVKSVIYDHAYYWPHFSAIPAPADEDVMLFSGSKTSGHASSRWALIKDEKVYDKVVQYMKVNTMGVSRDTQLRVLKLIKVILGEMGGGGDIFEFGYKALKNRWRKLNEIVSWSNRFSLQQIDPQYCTYFSKIRDPSPAYAWVKCEFEEDVDCAKVLKEAGIISRGGTLFEASSRYTRLSLIKTEDDFDLLLRKMVAVVSEDGVSSI
uniref:Alliinase C-terminal domain-containing protein n=1 Tax=Ananas comosus var. bracteatus TaxID=296719 RepID=A0A6V7PT97_ANACO|nr:unnamed protein product [Ananas comosus var. bracteatus]